MLSSFHCMVNSNIKKYIGYVVRCQYPFGTKLLCYQLELCLYPTLVKITLHGYNSNIVQKGVVMGEGLLADKKGKYILIFFVICGLLVNIKSIFMDYNYDAGYAVALAYRMVQGDAMFGQMWEPHQTSAFLCAGLMKLYLLITGTTTGIVLYLQAAGVVLKAVVALFFYSTISKLVRKDIVALMCLFFFAVTPKGLPLPEFSNMQIWFSLGLFCSLVRFFQNREGKGWLVAGAFFLCLEILAYPSCLIVYGGVLVLLFCYGEHKWKDSLLFSGICLICGIVYVAYFAIQQGWASFFENVGHIIFGDGSHEESLLEKGQDYLQQLGKIGLWLVGLALAVYVVLKVVLLLVYYCSGRRKRPDVRKYWVSGFFLVFLGIDMVQALRVELTYEERLPIYVAVIVVALFTAKHCDKKEQQFVCVGMVLSFLSFVATLLLTNLTISSTLNYLILAVMVSFLAIIRCVEDLWNGDRGWMRYGVILLFLAVTIFRTGYITKYMSTEKTNVLNVGNMVQHGPVKGILSEYLGPYILNVTWEEWKEYVQPGDKVLIVGAGLYDPILYLFEDVEICVASTICTPTYDSTLSEYWKQNPDKYPNVVIVDCWFGELRVDQNDWIMQWLKHSFGTKQCVDGNYWRYYRR